MHKSNADLSRNRLYVTLRGRITAQEANQAAAQIIADIETLSPGFDIITDISGFEPVTQEAMKLFAQVRHQLLEHGVGRITRVIGTELKATVAKIQFERAFRETNVATRYFSSVIDAERFLDCSGRSMMISSNTSSS